MKRSNLNLNIIILIMTGLFVIYNSCYHPGIFDSTSIDYQEEADNENGNQTGQGQSSSGSYSSASGMVPLAPLVKSFTITNTIPIEWSAHPMADTYILYKYSDVLCQNILGEFETDQLSYQDNAVTPGDFYYYKLAIKNSGVTYQKSDTSFGIASNQTVDTLEDNDRTNDAAFIYVDHQYNANIYYYRDSSDHILIDEDWYSIEIPPYTAYSLKIDQFSYIDDNELRVKISGASQYSITEGDEFSLINISDQTRDTLFLISVDSALFINEFGNYRLSILP